MRVTIDLSQVAKLAKTLDALNRKGLPFAVRKGLNETAFEARKQWKEQLGKTLTLRNTWTERSLRVDKVAAGYDVGSMQSKVGSTAPYMAEQEFGGSKAKKGRHGVPIPTAVAAGQDKGAQRTKAVRKRNYLSALSVTKRAGVGRKQQNAIAVKTAAKTGGVVFLDLGRRQGLFRVTGGAKRPRISMLYNLSKTVVVTPPHATLGPAIKVIEPKLASIHAKALQEQIDRAIAKR